MDPDLIRGFVGMLEAKDISTAAHTWRVVLYARALAERFTADHAFLLRLTFAAALHDVGKIDIPESILLKPGPLDAAERAIMERHAILGWERLRRMDEADQLILDLVRHHHERWDGLGYPDKLTLEAIPVAARYFSVVDSFDAMTSFRPYRTDVGVDAARRAIIELQAGIGTRYCADAVEAFTELYHTGSLDWILHYYNDQCEVPDYTALRETDKLRPR